jgi:nitrite reductase/ring-hydroxylating ferredoxin subunit
MHDEGWIPVLSLHELPDRRPTHVDLEIGAILVVRDGERLFAIGNRCSHQGASLHRGLIRFSGSLKTVRCPAHGSEFDLADGRVLRGPATQRVPTFEARAHGDTIEVRPSSDR